MRNYPVVTVSEKAEKSVKGGHPWVYGSEILSSDPSYVNGEIVDVCSQKGRWLGAGFINDHSKITVQIGRASCRERV